MTLRCPHCGFARELEAGQLPPRLLRVTCPRCQESFVFQRERETEAPAPAAAEPATAPEAAAEPPEAAPQEDPGAESAERPALTFTPLPVSPPAETRPAGFWVRAAAYLLDQLLLAALLLLGQGLLTGAALLAGATPGEALGGPVALLVNLFGVLLSLTYFVVFTTAGGQTPGKMILRLRVLHDGAPPGFLRAFVREVPGKFLSALLLMIGYLMVAFDPHKQGLHDRLAGTRVVRL